MEAAAWRWLPEDRHSLSLLSGVAFFVLCLVLHHAVSGAVFGRFTAYCRLPWQLKMEWDSRIVSCFHALLVSALSVYALLYEHPQWEGKINSQSQIGGVTLSISAAFMLADIISMPMYWRDSNLLVFWLHHGIAACCFIICVKQEVLEFFALLRLTSELSTTFLNIAWFNRLCNVSKASALSIGNAVCLTGSFLLCRIAVIPVYWCYFVQAAAEVGFYALLSQLRFSFALWLISSVILDVMNLHWSRKILRGGLRTAKTGLQMRGYTPTARLWDFFCTAIFPNE